jgi:hypothetical protein
MRARNGCETLVKVSNQRGTRLNRAYSRHRIRSKARSGRHPATPASLCLAGAETLERLLSSLGVDLDQLPMRCLDRIGRWHALDRLGIHVNDDVLGLHLGGLLVR